MKDIAVIIVHNIVNKGADMHFTAVNCLKKVLPLNVFARSDAALE